MPRYGRALAQLNPLEGRDIAEERRHRKGRGRSDRRGGGQDGKAEGEGEYQDKSQSAPHGGPPFL